LFFPNARFRFLAAGSKLAWTFGAIAALTFPWVMQGQRGSGHNRRPLVCVHDCTNSADEATPEDDLKSFNRVMALQGTPEQSAALVRVSDELQLAKKQLHTVQPVSGKTLAPDNISDTIALIDKSVASLRAETQTFLGSLSPAQKSGLRDLTKKSEDADAELAKQVAALDQVAKNSRSADQQLSDCTASLDKTLSNVEQDQVTLAEEMGIILPSTELTFSLTSTDSTNIGATPIVIPVSAEMSRTSSRDGSNTFAVKIEADLSNLQDKIMEVLRTQIDQASACGERAEIRESMLVPEAPASRIYTRVHAERWVCPTTGRGEPMEVASGEGSFELRLVPSIGKDGKLALDSQISHVEGNEFTRNLLLGNAGQIFKDKIMASVASAIQSAAESQLVPTSAKESPTMEKPEFRQVSGRLTFVLIERTQMSDQQTQDFARQLAQRSSAQPELSP